MAAEEVDAPAMVASIGEGRRSPFAELAGSSKAMVAAQFRPQLLLTADSC